jgi:hypothetical protein
LYEFYPTVLTNRDSAVFKPLPELAISFVESKWSLPIQSPFIITSTTVASDLIYMGFDLSVYGF